MTSILLNNGEQMPAGQFWVNGSGVTGASFYALLYCTSHLTVHVRPPLSDKSSEALPELVQQAGLAVAA